SAEQMVKAALASGAAKEKFRQMVAGQGGDALVVDDVTRLPQATHVHQLMASRSGFLQSLDALLVGRTAVALGAGRDKKSDPVDLSAGVLLHKKPGDAVTAGEPLLELRYNDPGRLQAALHLATQSTVIGDKAPPEAPLVIGWVHDSGEQMFVAMT
ncbi:MAG TPA: hypothetical protein VNT81_03275, partial [Vicinamibacterales bacterium]|nr:hypothetical protein [Vicinamibacterales bacterium]